MIKKGDNSCLKSAFCGKASQLLELALFKVFIDYYSTPCGGYGRSDADAFFVLVTMVMVSLSPMVNGFAVFVKVIPAQVVLPSIGFPRVLQEYNVT
jgi:hypothetical protein